VLALHATGGLAEADRPRKDAMNHTSISPQEAADRLAIRELIDAYARYADRRDAEGQKALFTEDTRFLVYMNGVGSEPTEALHGREPLTPVFAALNQYDVTMHFNGQSTVALERDRATGETYCIAHHVFGDGGERQIMLAYLRYLDTFVKQAGTWLFAERKLYLEFSDTRTLGG
jgi:SnoaL-like domain